MQPGMGMMMQPFMFDMNVMMQMGQMNIQNLDSQLPINPMIMGLSTKKEIQQHLNLNNVQKFEKK